MELDINRLRRRSPGRRVLVQLDQSTLSELVLSDAHAPTRELLMAGVQADKLVCPKSLGATDETLDLPELWQPISNLHEELSMGIEFLDPKQSGSERRSQLCPSAARRSPVRRRRPRRSPPRRHRARRAGRRCRLLAPRPMRTRRVP